MRLSWLVLHESHDESLFLITSWDWPLEARPIQAWPALLYTLWGFCHQGREYTEKMISIFLDNMACLKEISVVVLLYWLWKDPWLHLTNGSISSICLFLTCSPNRFGGWPLMREALFFLERKKKVLRRAKGIKWISPCKECNSFYTHVRARTRLEAFAFLFSIFLLLVKDWSLCQYLLLAYVHDGFNNELVE